MTLSQTIPLIPEPQVRGRLQLYPHQAAGIEDTRSAARAGHKRQILCAPTGSGKTECAIYLIDEARKRGSRVAFIVDSIPLVRQTHNRLSLYGIPHGIAQGRKNTRGGDELVQVWSAQTAEARNLIKRGLDLVIFDECHVRREKLMRQAAEDDIHVLGLTATPLTKRLGDYYSHVTNVVTTDWLLNNVNPQTEQPYLAPLRIYSGVATTEIDMEGAEIGSDGEYTARAVRERGGVVIGDVVKEWDRMCFEHFGRWVKTLVFSADVAHGEELCTAFQAIGADARQSTYRDSEEETTRLVEDFSANKFDVLVSVAKFCLDAKTDVLTSRGWVGMTEISFDHAVANYWPNDGSITFSRPKDIIHRTLAGLDSWVTHRRGLKVTSDHRMLVRSAPTVAWKTVPAHEIVGRTVQLPDCGVAEALDVPIPKPVRPSSDRARRIVANSYHLRKKGLSAAEARRVAENRIADRDSLGYLSPLELTLDQCRLIGFWLGDGSTLRPRSGGIGYRLTQSERYPDIVNWVDDLCDRLPYDVIRRTLSQTGKMTAPAVDWRFARGTGSGPQQRRGVFDIEPYLRKEGTPLFWGLDPEQFDALYEGLWMADGDHTARYKRPKFARRIASVRKSLMDQLQAIAVCRGYRAVLRPLYKPKKSNHRQSYMLSLSRKRDNAVTLGQRHTTGVTLEPARAGERAWCVETQSGYILIRRDGYVYVVGNCKGFDDPTVMCVVDVRKNRTSLTAVIQKMGRAMRYAPGKEYALYLDHVRNMEDWYYRILDVWENGVSVLHRGKDKKPRPKQTSREERPDVTCFGCGLVLLPGMDMCPACGRIRSRRTTKAVTVEGTLREFRQAKPTEWMKDESWVWSQLSRLALERKGGDVEAAQRSASGYYKGMYGGWPSWGRPLVPCEGPVDERVINRVTYSLIRYQHSQKRRNGT